MSITQDLIRKASNDALNAAERTIALEPHGENKVVIAMAVAFSVVSFVTELARLQDSTWSTADTLQHISEMADNAAKDRKAMVEARK